MTDRLGAEKFILFHFYINEKYSVKSIQSFRLPFQTAYKFLYVDTELKHFFFSKPFDDNYEFF